MKSKIRLILQLIVIAIIVRVVVAGWDVEAYCPLGGILSFGTRVYQNTMACSMSEVAIFMALALLVGALAVGKLFCSHVCPIGFISEWFGKLGKRMRLNFLLPKGADRPLRLLKYLLLFFVLYFTVTSSELFCKKFEPYYGLATGFGHDTVLWWSIAAVAIVVIGSILFKQIWCKYLCPLGAASNMFVNIYLVLIPFGLYFLVRLVVPDLSVMWMMGGLALLGFVWEAGAFRNVPLPLAKITVDQSTCTHCGLCTKACPYGIEIDTYTKVDHPDCMICSECAYACKATNSVAINRSRKLLWLPPALVVLLPLLGFALSTQYKFPTLQQRWGGFEEIENIRTYKQSDISNIKCYGTSMALYRQIKDKKGIYGVDTYASSHAVTVYYNPDEISETGVKAAIFNPRRYRTRNITPGTIDSLSIWEVGIENFFDLEDNMNLVRVLRIDDYVYGFETNFGEPVVARIFYDSDSTRSEKIRTIIDETKEVTSTVRGKEQTNEMDFACDGAGRDLGKVDLTFYRQRMFGAYDQAFNGYELVDPDALYIYEIGMPDAENFMVRRALGYLVSHLSADSSIVRVSTSFDGGRPVVHVFFDPARMDSATIYGMMTADTLVYFQRDGSKGRMGNGFEFALPARMMKAAEYVDPVEKAKERKLGAEVK